MMKKRTAPTGTEKPTMQIIFLKFSKLFKEA
jgi:hypothetical protein